MSLFEAVNICEEILTSKKYATLYKPMVLRICEEEYKKHTNDKNRIKAVKNVLHSMYGAYISADSYKKASKLMDNFIVERQEVERREILNNILHLHASTRERMQYLSVFYNYIFDNVGEVKSIVDIGCGFNPLTMSYFPEIGDIKYHALDIDGRIAELNNRYFSAIKMPPLARCVDIITETPDISADVVFLFKVLPLIDRQSKDRSARLIREIDAQYLIITYPTKSLTGKEKGMKSFYAAAFEDVLGGTLSIASKKQIGDELVYVVIKR